ncbi:conserved membrane hypothetical protein [Oenococcus oeni]|nr:conserved membrane hypothetical protein [Oenococcus oeni]
MLLEMFYKRLSNMKKTNYLEIFLKVVLSFIGIAILSAGASFCRISGFGLDPFTSVNLGIANHLGISLGTYQLTINFVILIFVFWLDKGKIGIGTVLNMVGVGFLIDIFTKLFINLWGKESSTWMSLGYLIIGLILFTLGSSLYMSTDMGVAPYDAIAPIATKITHLKYKVCRVTQDISFIIVGFFIGGSVGLASIIIAFFTGPLIVFWNQKISFPINHAISEFARQPSGKIVSHGFINIAQFTYRLVARGYDQTIQMQQQLSKYSNAEIETKKKDAHHTIENSRNLLSNAEKQLSMLKKEELKRGKSNE